MSNTAIACPVCGRLIRCAACAGWICPACGADLGDIKNIPFTTDSSGSISGRVRIEYTPLEFGNILRRKQRGGERQ